MDNKQISVARRKFSGQLSGAQLEYKLFEYENNAKRTYDKNKGSFDSHLANHLHKLSRDVHNSTSGFGISESNGLSVHKLGKSRDEFVMKNDREPTVDELHRDTGLDKKFISKYDTNPKLVISREINISPDEIDFKSIANGLNKEDATIAKASVYGGQPKSMSRATFFRKSKSVGNKMRNSYIHKNTVIKHDS